MTAGTMINLQGNQACARAAIAAGCRFFAGYPITPSSEIAETLARELPAAGGTFIQMEDEIASMAAVVGASMGGVKAMTATSGPGFSLKQENLGYASITETPCVVVNVMRGGPSTGMPTRPAQGDIMQARWGTHGDHSVIVVAPASVAETATETVRAFNLAERLRVPVVVLLDEVIGHLVETVDAGLFKVPPQAIATRRRATGPREGFEPFAETDDLVPPFARPGDGYRSHVTGLTHAPGGFPTQIPAQVERAMTRMTQKLVMHRDLIERFETVDCEDADTVIVAIGITARAARQAVAEARARGEKTGLFRPVTLWPFPEDALCAATAGARRVIVAEMNQGQLVGEVERVLARPGVVVSLARYDGEAISPRDVAAAIDANPPTQPEAVA